MLEEGGARLALGRRLASVRYNVGGRPKRVHYWAASVLSVDERAVPNSEVDEVAWVPAARAVERVSYAHDHRVLRDFAERPAGTVPLILLRHAKAVSKQGWKRTDAARPLDDSGRSDAKTLADLLACFASRPRLISSAAVRCTETLRPLSQLTGEQVRAEQALYIHNQSPLTGAADSADAIAALVRAAIASGEPTVICAHRENLPVLQEAALAALASHAAAVGGPALTGPAVSDGTTDAAGILADLPREWGGTLSTSGFWVLNVAPLPPEPAPVPEPEPVPSATSGPATGSPAPPHRWWRRILFGAGPAATPAPAPAAAGQPAPIRRTRRRRRRRGQPGAVQSALASRATGVKLPSQPGRTARLRARVTRRPPCKSPVARSACWSPPTITTSPRPSRGDRLADPRGIETQRRRRRGPTVNRPRAQHGLAVTVAARQPRGR